MSSRPRHNDETRRPQRRVVVRGLAGLAALGVVCAACRSTVPPVAQGSGTRPTTVAGTAVPDTAVPDTAVPDTAVPSLSGSAGAGRFAPCAQTNNGDVPLQFLGRKPPAQEPLLLPAGADAALICRYAGIGDSQPAGALVATLQIGSQPAEALVSVIDAGVPLDLTQMPPSCPSNAAGVYALQFGYPQGRVVVVTSTLNGCPWTVVGDRAVWTSSSALQAFAALVGGQISDNILGPQPAAITE